MLEASRDIRKVLIDKAESEAYDQIKIVPQEEGLKFMECCAVGSQARRAGTGRISDEITATRSYEERKEACRECGDVARQPEEIRRAVKGV